MGAGPRAARLLASLRCPACRARRGRTQTALHHPFTRTCLLPAVQPLPQAATNAAFGSWTDVPVVEMTQKIVEREDVPRRVAVAREDYLRPAAHPRGSEPVAADAQLPARDRANEHLLVPAARQRAHGEQVRPRAQSADALVRRG